ncbi:UDP-N-acetylglucosamine 1-carboxyvinyltransferase [Brotaphodocola sp.]|uniref:UDP-N-acetylglucosamine 1-carboxyvinyltransferase n=1 Tax=Brotaphodocola sp. TaxID=3073577 RepID=UPI003D7E7B3D
MSVIHIRGRHGLNGEIRIQGSKNGVLPIMAGALLHRGTTVITNVPIIQDVLCMMGILEYLGCHCTLEDHTAVIDATYAEVAPVPCAMSGQMRSSVMLLGPMLGRFRLAVSRHPGGCCLGNRPVNLHLDAFRALGAQIRTEGEQICVFANRLHPATIRFPYPSVGATENAILAAAAVSGATRILGAAREPEIEMLCAFLGSMGAKITGGGTSCILIEGGVSLHDSTFEVNGDRIVAGTYLGALLRSGGRLLLRGAAASQMEESLRLLSSMGMEIAVRPEGILAKMSGRPCACDFSTGPYPEFPTDLQPVMMAGCASADGESRIRENVFEKRFSCAEELRKLGASIIIEDRFARVKGRHPLHGARVQAKDLRGGAALVAAGLAAEGETFVEGYEHISRGYEDISRDLAQAGAEIALE